MSNLQGACTAERRALLVRDYPTTRDVDLIMADINSLPGPQFARTKQIRRLAQRLKLHRPKEAIEITYSTAYRDARRGEIRFTGERLDAMRTHYGRCRTVAEAHAIVAQLPGAPFTAKQLANRAGNMGLKLARRNKPPGPVPKSPQEIWTPERDAVFTGLRGTMPNRDVLARVNELPGPVVTLNALERKIAEARKGNLAGGDASFRTPKKIRVKKVRPQRVAKVPNPKLPPKPRKSSHRTPERLALIVSRFGATQVAALLTAVNALPGLPMGIRSFERWISALRMPGSVLHGRRKWQRISASIAPAYVKPQPVRIGDRTADVAAWIAMHGVTKCPTSGGGVRSSGTISPADSAALAAHHAAREAAETKWRKCGWIKSVPKTQERKYA